MGRNPIPRRRVSTQFPTPSSHFSPPVSPLPPPTTMWGRMWSSGRGGALEREGPVRSDGARKRAARKWSNKGLEPPPTLLRHETEEYDRRHGHAPSSAAGSSSAARSSHAASSSSSGASLLPVKREWSEEPEEIEVVAVKQEPEEIERRGVVGPEDFVADVDAVAAAIAERSLREEAERRRHDEELEALMLQQTVGRTFRQGEGRRVAAHPRGAEGEVHRPRQLRRGGLSSSTASSMAASSPP